MQGKWEDEMRHIVVGLALASLGFGPAHALDELKVATGGRGGWEVSVTELGLSADMFKKHGLDVKLSYTEGSGETMQAAISGAVDVALGIGPFGIMGAYARGAPVRILGATMTGVNIGMQRLMRRSIQAKSLPVAPCLIQRLVLQHMPLCLASSAHSVLSLMLCRQVASLQR